MGLAERDRRLDRDGKAFAWGLTAIVLAGWAWNIFFVLNWRRGIVLHGDAQIYHEGANLLAKGRGFVDPIFRIGGRPRQAANSPPLFLIWLAIPSWLGFTTPLAHSLWSTVLGAATIAVVGLTGREIAGRRAGIIAAVIAAAYPQIWYWDGAVLLESMAILTLSVTLLLAYRYWRAPSWRRAAWLGLAAGLATMSRAELILLFPLLVVPLVLLTRTVETARRWKWLGAAAILAALPVLPWVTYNLFRFEHPVTLSVGFEVTLAASNCDETYHGPYLGYWWMNCAAEIRKRDLESPPSPRDINYDQSQEAVVFRRAALRYIREHADRLPVVVLARFGRVTELWNLQQTIALAQFPEGMEAWVAKSVAYGFYAVAGLGIVGAFVLRRHRVPVFPFLATPVTVLVVTAITFANLRYRATAETSFVLLAAVAIDAGLRAMRPTAPAAPEPLDEPAADPPVGAPIGG